MGVNPTKIINLLKQTYEHINEPRKAQLSFIVVLMLFTSAAEVISISAVFPFLAAISDPIVVFNHPFSVPFLKVLGIQKADEIIMPLTLFFGAAIIISGFLRLLLLWKSTKVSYGIGTDLGVHIYERTLYQPYSIHITRNTSEIIDGIFNKTTRTMVVINLALNIVSGLLILSFVLTVALLVDFFSTMIVFSGFGVIYFLIARYFRKKVLIDSERVANETTQIVKLLQEGLGGIKDVIITGSQSEFKNIFYKADHPYRMAQARNIFAGSSPRFIVETLVMLLIIISSYIILRENGEIISFLPAIGVIALSVQRLMPIIQQVYASWTGVMAESSSLQDTLKLLNQPIPSFVQINSNEELEFNNSIILNDVSFSYSKNLEKNLNKINFEVFKGETIGLIGKTGSGKSTLLDIMMGLLDPTEGEIRLDGKLLQEINRNSWLKSIAHVQQDIYLSDSSVAQNIAFGEPLDQVDLEKVIRSAKLAKINEYIESLPLKYDTKLGERGVRISGGQCQRIGIARAVYKNAKIIFFDEATSSLDTATERDVMNSISNLDKELTVIIVAHRLSTLKNCKKIIELDSGMIKRIVNYKELST